MSPQYDSDLREPVHHLPEGIPIGETNFFHPVRTDIYRVMMQGNDCGQIRVLFQGLGQEVQLRIGQRSKNLAGHRGVQHDELPPSPSNVAGAGVKFVSNFRQISGMIMIARNPERRAGKRLQTLAKYAVGIHRAVLREITGGQNQIWLAVRPERFCNNRLQAFPGF